MMKEKLKEIVIDNELQKLVNNFNVPGGWTKSDECITKFKDTIKPLLKSNQNNCCAYCGLPLGTRNPEIDHIAPKGGEKRPKHYEVTFLPLNLVYACHYCNSTECKGQKDVVESKLGEEYSKWQFKLVHPYLDDPKDYFEIKDNETIIYLPKKDSDLLHRQKAEYTIEMFNLNSEAHLMEKAKQILFERNPEHCRKIVLEISTYMP